MVLSAEVAPDLGQRLVRQVLAKIHGDLAREGDLLRVVLRLQLADLQVVVVRHDLLDRFHADHGRIDGEDVLQRLLRERQRDGPVLDGGIGADPIESPLELADVRLDLARDEQRNVRGKLHAESAGLLAQDRDLRFEVGRLDVRHEPPREPRHEPFLQRADLLRLAVARQDDVSPGLVKRVEGMEELLLGPLLARQELDVVDEEQVDAPVPFPELDVLVESEGVDHLVDEFLGGDVLQAQ